MRSYVIRVQDPPSATSSDADDAVGDTGQLRGVIETVATGERRSFRSAEELVCALRCAPERLGGLGSTTVAADLDHAHVTTEHD